MCGLCRRKPSCLELVFDRQFQNSLCGRPGLLIQNTEVIRIRVRVGSYVGSKGLARIIGVVVQRHLALSTELGQRMVQPVECRSTELDSVPFCYVEGFISSQVADDQRRPAKVGPILAAECSNGRRSKATVCQQLIMP